MPAFERDQQGKTVVSVSVCVSDGSGSKIFDPGRVGSIFCGSGRVGSDIHGFGLNFENFP